MSRVKLAAAFLAAVLLAACASGSPHASVAACKHAIRSQVTAAVGGATNPPEPAACKGLPPRTLEKLLSEIITGH